MLHQLQRRSRTLKTHLSQMIITDETDVRNLQKQIDQIFENVKIQSHISLAVSELSKLNEFVELNRLCRFNKLFKLNKHRLIVSSRVLEFKSSTWLEKCWIELKFFWKKCWVELRSWIQELKLSWEAWFNNSTQKLDSIQQDIK